MYLNKIRRYSYGKKKPYIGVDAIIRNEEGKILLIHRTGKNFNGYWGLVSGMIEWGKMQKVH